MRDTGHGDPRDTAPVDQAADHAPIAQAREFVRGRLRGFEQALVDDCLLVVSELVTNALRHGGGLVGYDLAAHPGRIRLSVRDRSDQVPAIKPPSGNWHPGGYGWPLVCRLAEQVTIVLLDGGGKDIQVDLAA